MTASLWASVENKVSQKGTGLTSPTHPDAMSLLRPPGWHYPSCDTPLPWGAQLDSAEPQPS